MYDLKNANFHTSTTPQTHNSDNNSLMLNKALSPT